MITNTTTGVSVMEAKQRTILQQGGEVKPDPEVPEKPTRRRFTAEYKLCILRLADGWAAGLYGLIYHGTP
ncbi:hypothetical protein KAT59_06990 [Candidatus Bipolaricaulota bacterium]|jgi:hypothetical protein|nr:hypothetical protein [Candidatus Bipolaricaulota bacterium]